MSQDNFTPTTESFNDIIDNSKTYYVPKYQRDYTWNNKDDDNWDLLWEDITSVNDKHYVGILVLQPDADKKISIIDGQQRLTTITLVILAALYLMKEQIDNLDNTDEKQEALERLDILLGQYVGKKQADLRYHNKITLNINNKNFFSTLCDVKNQRIDSLKSRGEHPSNKTMHEALKFFYEKMLERNKSGMLRSPEDIFVFIRDNVVNKLFFTVITVATEQNAYMLFETLNSRSVELTAYDLLKNHLLSKADEHEESMFDDIKEMSAKISENKANEITKFVALDWNSRNKKLTEKRVFREISQNIDTKDKAFRYMVQLKKSSNIYAKLKNSDDENHDIAEMLTIFNFLNVKQQYMILLALYNVDNDNYSKKNVIETLLNIAIRYNYIGQGQANRQEKAYNDIAIKISRGCYKNSKEIVRDLMNSDLVLSDDAFIQAFVDKDFKNEKVDRYILARIEHNISGIEADYNKLTIEHISDKKHKAPYTFKIGNQTILGGELNGALSDKTFNEKKERYKTVGYEITRSINANSWNEIEVNKRSRDLALRANKIFK